MWPGIKKNFNCCKKEEVDELAEIRKDKAEFFEKKRKELVNKYDLKLKELEPKPEDACIDPPRNN